jgi:hypothetical protein
VVGILAVSGTKILQISQQEWVLPASLNVCRDAEPRGWNSWVIQENKSAGVATALVSMACQVDASAKNRTLGAGRTAFITPERATTPTVATSTGVISTVQVSLATLNLRSTKAVTRTLGLRTCHIREAGGARMSASANVGLGVTSIWGTKIADSAGVVIALVGMARHQDAGVVILKSESS